MKMNHARLLNKPALVAAAMFAGHAMAATVVWNGGDGSVGDASVATAANWEPSVVPGSDDIAAFGSTTSTVTLDSTPTWSGLTFGEPSTGEATLTINAGSPSSNELTLGAKGIDLTGTAAGIGNVAINSAVKLGVSQAWRVADGRTLTVSRLVSAGAGSGTILSINEDGSAGTVDLGGGVSNNTTVNIGGGKVVLLNKSGATVNLTGSASLSIAGSGATQSGTYGMKDGTTLEFLGAGASPNAIVTGSGTVKFNTTWGSGIYGQYTNVSAFDGTIQILGLLRFGSTAGFSNAATAKIQVFNGSELGFNYAGGNSVTVSTPISLQTGTNLKLAQYGAGTLTIDSVLSDVGSLADSVTLGGSGIAATATLKSSVADMVAGKSTSLVLQGGSWILTGTNTFTGGTTIGGDLDLVASNRKLGGSLLLGGDTVLGSGAVQLKKGGRLASSDTTSRALGNDIRISGTTFIGDATRTGALTLNGGVTLGSDTTLNVDSAVVVTNGISGGSYALSKKGTGQLTLSGHSTFTGALGMGGGRTVIDSNGGPSLDTKSLVFNGDAYLVLSSSSGSAANLSFTSTSILAGNASIIREGNATGYVDLGAVTLSGGSLNVEVGSFVKTNLTNNGSGSLATSITFAGGLAKTDANGYIAAYDGGYSEVAYLTGVITDRSGAPILLVSDNGTAGNVTLGAPATRLDLLLQGQSSATTIRLGSNNMVFANGDGTIQVASDVTTANGALTIGIAGDSGKITSQNESAANAAAKLTFDNKSRTNPVTVLSPIVDGTTNGTASVSLMKIGSGTVILAGTNTYTGTTTIGAGALQIGNGGTTGSIDTTSAIINADALIYNRSDDITVGAVISGAGSLVKSGAGKLTLTAANTYEGTSTNSNLQGADGNYYGTIINAGTLQIGAGGSIASFSGATSAKAVLNNGKIIFNNTSGPTVDAVIAGTGSIETAAGNVTLTAVNSFTGSITVGSGLTLTIAGAGSVGNAPVQVNGSSTLSAAVKATLSGGGSLVFNSTGSSRLDTVTVAAADKGSITNTLGKNMITGAVTGNVSITVNAGTLTLSGHNTFKDTASISITNGAILELGDQNSAIAYDGDVDGLTKSLVNDGTLAIYHGNNTTVSISTKIEGAGSLIVGGGLQSSGTVSLTKENTYSGKTSIVANGILELSGEGTMGTNAGEIVMDKGVFSYNRTEALTIGNIFSGTGALKIKQGKLTLTGANTYTRGTTVDVGSTLILSGTGSIASTGSITVNGTLNLNTTAAFTLGNSINGTGVIHQISTTGIVSLTGTSSFSGSYQIDSGTTIKVGTGGSSGTLASAKVDNSGSLIWNRSGADAYGGSMTGAGNVTIGGGVAVTFTGANTYTGATVINSGSTLRLGDGTATDLDSIISASIITNNGTLALNGKDGAAYSQVIGGAGGVSILGSGRTTLSATNTFSGLISVTNGTLVAGSAGSLGSGSSITVNSVGGLDLNGNVLTGYSTLTLSKGTISDTGSAGSIAANAFALQSGNVNATLTGAGSVTKSTAGIVTINAAQSFTGSITLAATGGTLQLAGASTLSGGAYAGAVALGSSSTLRYSSSGNQTLSGVISGAGALQKDTSDSTLILTGANTYTGDTTLSKGTLQIGSGTSGGSLGTTKIANSAALVFDSSTATAVGGIISGSGTLTKQGTGTTTLTGANTYTGDTTISAGTLQIGSGTSGGSLGSTKITNNAALVFDSSSATAVGGIISGSGTLTKQGSGTATLTGANTYTGITTISAGTLEIGTGGSLGSGDVTDNGILSFNTTATPTVTAIISGTGALTQKGSGTTVLSNAGNSYAGGTTVNGGVLRAGAGNVFGTGAISVNNGGTLNTGLAGTAYTFANTITVNSGGTLMGAGTHTGLVTFKSGGILSPGNSPGTTTFNAGATFESGSTYKWEIQGAAPGVPGVDYDQFVVTGGTATVNAGAILKLQASSIDYSTVFWDTTHTFTNGKQSGGTITGAFNLDTLAAGSFGAQGSWMLGTNGGDLTVVWTPIPEPATYGLVGAGALASVALVRRRRKAL